MNANAGTTRPGKQRLGAINTMTHHAMNYPAMNHPAMNHPAMGHPAMGHEHLDHGLSRGGLDFLVGRVASSFTKAVS
jgi:hypothetical protein